jgi:hypothetical protein
LRRVIRLKKMDHQLEMLSSILVLQYSISSTIGRVGDY